MLMLHAYTSSTDLYWRIPDSNWQVHLEQCNRNLEKFHDPPQLRGNVNLSKLKTARNSVQKHQEKYLSHHRRTAMLGLLLNFYTWIHDSKPSKKTHVIWFIESPLKMIKNAFYFILKALFVLNIFKFYHDFLVV